jgi:hypothetical protein
MDDSFRQQAYDLARVRALSKRNVTLEEGYHFEYGLALVKTSASLVYTQTLALAHRLQPATDSPAHFALYIQSCARENWVRTNHLLTRTGYKARIIHKYFCRHLGFSAPSLSVMRLS